MASPYTTPSVCIEISDHNSTVVLHVHQAIVAEMPYFTAQQARWAKPGEKLKLLLPEGVVISNFVTLLDHFYSPSQHLHFVDVIQGLNIVKTASMLDCNPSTVKILRQALQSAMRSDEDVEAVSKMCQDLSIPIELQRVTKRPRLQADELTMAELKDMLHCAALQQDAETLDYVGKHLKQRSRRGGSVRQEVADVLSKETGAAAINLALQFLQAHPGFFRQFVDSWHSLQFEGEYRDFSFEEEASLICCEGRTALMDLGLNWFFANVISDKDLVACFHMMLEHFHRDMTKALADVLRSIGVDLQLEICRHVLTEKEERGKSHSIWGPLLQIHQEPWKLYVERMMDAAIVRALSVEAKAVFVNRVVNLDDQGFVQALTEPMLKAFGESNMLTICKRVLSVSRDSGLLREFVTVEALELIGIPGMRVLVPAASAFKRAVKTRILCLTAPTIGNDSEEGF